MNLSTIRTPKKSTEKKKRVGRGMGSGMGKTSTRRPQGAVVPVSGARSDTRGFEGRPDAVAPAYSEARGFTNIFPARNTTFVKPGPAGNASGKPKITPEVLKKGGAW